MQFYKKKNDFGIGKDKIIYKAPKTMGAHPMYRGYTRGIKERHKSYIEYKRGIKEKDTSPKKTAKLEPFIHGSDYL